MWLTAGGVETAGWKGFAKGLVVANALVNDFWEGLFPTRPKTRANIVTWLSERALAKIEKLEGHARRRRRREARRERGRKARQGARREDGRCLYGHSAARHAREEPRQGHPRPAAAEGGSSASRGRRGDFFDDDDAAPQRPGSGGRRSALHARPRTRPRRRRRSPKRSSASRARCCSPTRRGRGRIAFIAKGSGCNTKRCRSRA